MAVSAARLAVSLSPDIQPEEKHRSQWPRDDRQETEGTRLSFSCLLFLRRRLSQHTLFLFPVAHPRNVLAPKRRWRLRRYLVHDRVAGLIEAGHTRRLAANLDGHRRCQPRTKACSPRRHAARINSHDRIGITRPGQVIHRTGSYRRQQYRCLFWESSREEHGAADQCRINDRPFATCSDCTGPRLQLDHPPVHCGNALLQRRKCGE